MPEDIMHEIFQINFKFSRDGIITIMILKIKRVVISDLFPPEGPTCAIFIIMDIIKLLKFWSCTSWMEKTI